MRRFLISVLFVVFFVTACQHHDHTSATTKKDKPVLQLNHCDYSSKCFNALNLLYKWPANDLNTPYGAGLRVMAVRAVLSGVILDTTRVKHARIDAIAKFLGIDAKTSKILDWASKESAKLQSIPEVKKDALAMSRVIQWMAKPGCTSVMTALKSWQTFTTKTRPLALLYAVSGGYSLLTFYPESDEWLNMSPFKQRLRCVDASDSASLSDMLFGLYKQMAVAVRAGMNHPDPALASTTLLISKFLTDKGMALPIEVADKGLIMGVDMPKSLRSNGIRHHPEYLILVTKGRLRIVLRPRIKGLDDVSVLPRPKTILDIKLTDKPDRALVPIVQKALAPLIKTWKLKESGYLPIVCDRNITATDLMLAISLVVGVSHGYPMLAVYDQDSRVPVFIPFNTVSAERGFILPNGRFRFYDKKMKPVVLTLKPGVVEVQSKQGGPPEVFDFAMDKLPDLRDAYKAISKIGTKERYLEFHVGAKVPVWTLVAFMQTLFYRVSPKDLVSAPAFLAAGMSSKDARRLKPLFDDSLVLPEKK